MQVTGQVRCGKLVRAAKHPRLEGFANIIVVSQNAKWGQLSPMKLGPLTFFEPLVDGVVMPGFDKYDDELQVATCNIMENYWQYSKIYSVDVVDGQVQDSFYQRRAVGFKSNVAKRRVFAKKSGVTTVAAYHDGKVLGYVDSRLYYCHYYSQLVKEHPMFVALKSLVTNGTNVLILDYDGPDVDSHNTELTLTYVYNEYINPHRPFGHGMVLCSMLLGIEPWH